MRFAMAALIAVSFFACGSRTEFGVVTATASRGADDRVEVVAEVRPSYIGTDSSDNLVTELCVRASWSLAASDESDAGQSSDGGQADAGTASDAGLPGAGGKVSFLPLTRVGTRLADAEVCGVGNSGGTVTLRSSAAIPRTGRVIVTLAPAETEASQRARAGKSVVSFRDAQFVSP